MTTIFGLTHPSEKMAILVADRQTTRLDGVTGLPKGKSLGRKIWVSDDGDYCFGHTGTIYPDFLEKLAKGGFDIEGITKRGYFPALRKLNIKSMGRKLPNLKDLTGIILITRFDNDPKLFTCFPLGEVGERGWTSAGSGDEIVAEYMKSLTVLSQARDYRPVSELKTGELFQIGLEAVRSAQGQDVYSHGLDMMVCTPERINDHYTDLGDNFASKLRKIQRQYNGKTNKDKTRKKSRKK